LRWLAQHDFRCSPVGFDQAFDSHLLV
jgi:hypothetical protein